ncbi:MliC family protein [Pantoea sp. 1.19]|uniref:MliC family protein n=1 Tax=Pantoea sp. 1.19 TaxID=1925589 RepID=UPI000A5B500C|nr:MliC family protein [Pantoea sp. 1.19]
MRRVLCMTTLLLSGCSLMPPAPSPVQTLHYRCGTLPLTVSLDNARSEVAFVIDGQSVTLKEQIAASGARYSNGTYTFWSKGNGAFVERNDKVIIDDCELQPAN